MTAVAVPYADQGLFHPCPIAGCTSITDTEGQPCKACRELFGEYLTHNPGGRPMTSEQIRQHKADTLAAYRAQTAPPGQDASSLDTIRRMLAGQDAPVEPERRRNQRCWCCEEVHACTRNAQGLWECDTCRDAPC